MLRSIFFNLTSLFLVLGLTILSLVNPRYTQAQSITTFNPPVSEAREGQVVLPRFLTGDNVIINEAHAGTVFVAGSSINVNAPVGGDLVVGGASVIINAPVNQDIYAVGASVVINAPVNGNVVVAGSEVQLLENAKIKGSVISAGQSMQLLGQVVGQLLSSGKRELIVGQVGDDALFVGRELEIAADASIGGNLRAQLQNDDISEQASIAGVIDIQRDPNKYYDRWEKEINVFKPAALLTGALYSFTWKTILLIMLLFFVPKLVLAGSKIIDEQGSRVLTSGMVAVIGVPILSVFTMLTVIGLPIGLITLTLYAWLLFVVWIFPTIWVGMKILPARNKYVQAILGVAVLVVLSIIPILGMVLKLAVATVGLGSLVLLVKSSTR